MYYVSISMTIKFSLGIFRYFVILNIIQVIIVPMLNIVYKIHLFFHIQIKYRGYVKTQ